MATPTKFLKLTYHLSLMHLKNIPYDKCNKVIASTFCSIYGLLFKKGPRVKKKTDLAVDKKFLFFHYVLMVFLHLIHIFKSF